MTSSNCKSPSGKCDQTTCFDRCAWDNEAKPQARFWMGPEGEKYHERSPGDEESNYHFFRKALACSDLKRDARIIELGCGTGANLRALRRIYMGATMAGVDLNRNAVTSLPEDVEQVRASVLDWEPHDEWQLAITKGLLIHIAPDDLPKAYATLVAATNRYVLVCEYYCPTPRMIQYRGQDDRLWARDFAGEIMRAHGLCLVDYGFTSKYDEHPQDDLTYWLMEKP